MRADWRDALRRWWPSGFAEGAGPLADWLVRDRADGNAADPRQFSAWLPYRAYDADGALFQNRDGVGFCLDVLPQAGADERMAEILQSLVANCPPGAGLQLHLFASPAVRGMLTRYANLRVKDTDHLPRMQAAGRPVRQKNVFRALARKRVGFLLAGASRSLTQGFHYTVRDFRLVLSVHLPGRLRDFARREELLSLREAMVTTLNAAAFPSRPFDAADLIAWCAIFCNPQRILVEAPPPTYDEGRELFEQIVDFDTAQEALADGRGLRFSAADPSAAAAIEVRFYAVKTFPERFALWQMGGLTGDLLQGALQYPCPFLLTLGVEMLDPETTRAAVYANQTRATQNAESQMAKLLPDIPKKKRDWDAAADALDAGTKLVSLYHELALFTPPDRATQAEESAKAIWRSRGFRAQQRRLPAPAVAAGEPADATLGELSPRPEAPAPGHHQDRRQCGPPGPAAGRVEGDADAGAAVRRPPRPAADARSLRQRPGQLQRRGDRHLGLGQVGAVERNRLVVPRHRRQGVDAGPGPQLREAVPGLRWAADRIPRQRRHQRQSVLGGHRHPRGHGDAATGGGQDGLAVAPPRRLRIQGPRQRHPHRLGARTVPP